MQAAPFQYMQLEVQIGQSYNNRLIIAKVQTSPDFWLVSCRRCERTSRVRTYNVVHNGCGSCKYKKLNLSRKVDYTNQIIANRKVISWTKKKEKNTLVVFWLTQCLQCGRAAEVRSANLRKKAGCPSCVKQKYNIFENINRLGGRD